MTSQWKDMLMIAPLRELLLICKGCAHDVKAFDPSSQKRYRPAPRYLSLLGTTVRALTFKRALPFDHELMTTVTPESVVA